MLQIINESRYAIIFIQILLHKEKLKLRQSQNAEKFGKDHCK